MRRIALTEGERKLYAAQTAAALKGLSEKSGRMDILAALTRLRQIC